MASSGRGSVREGSKYGPSVNQADTKNSYFIPGYGGYCPTVKYSNGTTYAKATQNFWDLTRSESLNTSVISLNRRNSYSGEGVILSLATSQSRPGSSVESSKKTSTITNYSLTHTGPRRDEILQFEKNVQKHRTHYKDHTGIVPRMYEFAYHARRHSEPSVSYSRKDSRVLGGPKTFTLPSAPSNTLKWSRSGRRGSATERSTRDQYFERR